MVPVAVRAIPIMDGTKAVMSVSIRKDIYITSTMIMLQG